MELWIRLFLVVLVAMASTRGERTTDRKEEVFTSNATDTPRPLTPEAKSSPISSSTTSSHVFSTSVTTPRGVKNSSTERNDTETTPSWGGGKAGSSITTATVTMATDTTATDATSVQGTAKLGSTSLMSEQKHWGSTAGYVVLVLIIVVIILLFIVLFCLRRASRTYSFDLQRPAPPNHVHLPTFEPIHLHDFEQTTPKVLQSTENQQHPVHPATPSLPSLPAPPAPPAPPAEIPNGMSRRSEGEGSSDESHASSEEQLAANVSKVLPKKNVFHTSDNLTETQPDQWSCTDLFFDAESEGRQNQKTPSVCSSEPFVEVNIEEDVW